MDMEVSEKSKKTKKTTKSSTKNVKKKVVKKTSKTENKSARVKTNITKNETSKNKHNRKFTLDIIELLDGKVNKNIVFFGFWFVISILPFFSVKLSRSGPTSYTVLERLWLLYLFLTGFCYWTYLMIKHRFILKSFVLLIFIILFLCFFSIDILSIQKNFFEGQF